MEIGIFLGEIDDELGEGEEEEEEGEGGICEGQTRFALKAPSVFIVFIYCY